MNDSHSSLLDKLIRELTDLRDSLLGLEQTYQDQLAGLPPACVPSARNLLHYLALRGHDIRKLQDELATLGLSSLGRAEACVLANLDAVLSLLQHLRHRRDLTLESGPAFGLAESKALLKQRTEDLLGLKPAHRSVRIMVTMPSEAAHDYAFVRDALTLGMDCMRINCAHDDAATWASMIEKLRQAETETGKHCRILMDLAGPKLRTGPLEPGPKVVKCRPQRDCLGRATAPTRVCLAPSGKQVTPPGGVEICLPVPANWLVQLDVGDRVKFQDARGSNRTLRVIEMVGQCRIAQLDRTAYVATGSRLWLRKKEPHDAPVQEEAAVGDLPALVVPLILRPGDTLLLTKDLQPGRPETRDEDESVRQSARIGCTLPEVFADLLPGQRVWFDDGKIGGIIRRVAPDHARVEITHASPKGNNLGPDKGINLPDTELHLPALTQEDVKNLDFIVSHADMVGFSFVNSAAGVAELQALLAERGGHRLGIVLKIETPRAFEHLPEMLLTALRRPSVGVMIARGDLAVECGYERLAELQEEILWVCEAAHVPVIWATQVLENLAKLGMPSRAEITDAAMGERAECVMLNKGPHIREALRVLDDILRRMEGHQSKKRPTLRRLGLSDHFRPAVEHAVMGPRLTSIEASRPI
jgi:pyruvate kinase